jgi:hypothetical protein
MIRDDSKINRYAMHELAVERDKLERIQRIIEKQEKLGKESATLEMYRNMRDQFEKNVKKFERQMTVYVQ